MLKTLMSSLALTAALSLALPAYAQVTDQTDQSEDDWRKSRKKSGTSSIYRTPNTNSTGVGTASGEFEPISPVERLPSESRRHLMKERAKAIAMSEDGDISDAEFEPSEAAQSDEQLKRDEQEAWDVLVTDMQGSGGTATSNGGPNKVAVSGQNGATPTRGSRGGSTRTLQEIMDAIKAGQTGGGSGTESGASGPSAEGQSQSQGTDQGDSEQVADASAQGQGVSSGTSADGQPDATGESQSQSEGQSQSDGRSQDSDSGDQSASTDGDQAATSDAATWPAATRAEEPLSPLERIRRSREDRPTRGTERSASDYLGTGVVTDKNDD